MVQQKVGFSTSKASVPSEKSDSATGTKVSKIMLTEIDIVVGRYYGNGGATPSGSMVDPLAGVTSSSRTPNNWRGKADKFSFN